MLVYRDVASNPVQQYPVPVVDGLTITIPAGTYILSEETVVFAEDETYTVVPGVLDLDIHGYIVRVTATNEVHLFVDDIAAGDTGYSFDDGTYAVLLQLFSLHVVPGTTTLADISVRVKRAVGV